MVENLTFITGNEGKARELSQILGISIERQKIDLDEIQSLDFLEIVEHKVKEAYKIVNGPVLVEDSGLTFEALGRLPGPLIKWFVKELPPEKICKLLDAFPDRSATAHCYYAYYDGEELIICDGKVSGKITKAPRGERGFGWDPIFEPEGSEKTFAEMSADEKNADSHRTRALHKLRQFLLSK